MSSVSEVNKLQCHLGHVKQMPLWLSLPCLVSVDLGDWLCAEPRV